MTGSRVPRVEIVPVDPLAASGRERFAAWAGVHAEAEAADLGDLASPWTVAELVEQARSPAFARTDLAALVGGEVVAAGEVELPLRDNPGLAQLWVSVVPAHRRAGVGSALLAALEAEALRAGRTVLLAESSARPGGPDPASGFAPAHGYAAAQQDLCSELPLAPLPPGLDRLAAGDGGAPGYRVETAVDGLPEDWLGDRALLERRMSTDIPLGEVEYGEEDWDAGRVREHVRAQLAAGRRLFTAVARHADSGRLVGYTELATSTGVPGVALQNGTLVLDGHRGHGLGLRMKAANLLALHAELPGVARVRTWNARENAHMLAVNTALGFVPRAVLTEWQRRVG